MMKIIRNTKRFLHLLLAVLTVICALLSYQYHEENLEVQTTPQVMRAMTQVSRLLPQLEENEQAVREVYDNLERSRRVVLHGDKDADAALSESGENADTLIDHTLSWMNRVIMLRVGRRGHVIVISKADNTILAHPDEQFVGEKLYPIGNVDMDAAPELSSLEQIGITGGFKAFFPSSFFQEKVSPDRFYAAADAGIYGTAFAYEDTYILCGITLIEAIILCIMRSLFTTLIFFSIAFVLVRYIGFSLEWRKEEQKAFCRRLRAYALIALIVQFSVTWYYETIMDVTGDLATINEHSQAAVENLNTYRNYRSELSEWLDKQYLTQCRLAAELVRHKGKENLTRQELAKYAEELRIKYIYVFDRTGKVIVTNSPYDHFMLSSHEGDQSYAFRPLLAGKEYVIQEPQQDDAGGEYMQYIGVSLRDEEDLADGFVQIAVDPELRERLLSPINVQTVLDNLVIGLPDYALAIDKATLQVVATTGLGFVQAGIAELGIQEENLKTGFNGFYDNAGITYYAGVSESEDLFLMPLTRSMDNQDSLFTSLKLTLFGALSFLLFAAAAFYSYGRLPLDNASEDEGKAGEKKPAAQSAGDGEEDEERGIFRSLKSVIKTQDKAGFEGRWKKQSSIPLSQQTPEMRTKRIIYRILLVFSLALILLEFFVVTLGIKTTGLDGLSYVILGNWERGFNLFSFSYCLFLLCVLYVFQELLNQTLYRMAKLSDLKDETILLLLRNALKYSCALLFLYIGLDKFGVDTRALWASVGVLSLMIGIGAKDLISDVIAGLFIIFEGTYKIGDTVIVGSWFGTVEEIGIRYTKISFFSDTKIFNNSSIRDIVNCGGEVAREVVKIPIPYETDLLEIEKLLGRELPVMAKNVPGLVKPPKYQGVDAFGDSSVMLRIAIFCSPGKRKQAPRALLREIKLLFDREHVNIPYNHMVVMDYKDEENTYTFAPKDEEADKDAQ